MSSPSTPASVRAGSMRDPRSPSPSGSQGQGLSGPAAGELTPRSKIKALLANFDDDEDGSDDQGSSNARERLRATIAMRNKGAEEKSNNEAVSFSKQKKIDSNEEESDDEVALRPRGRLAARMMMASKKDMEQEKDDEPQKDEENNTGKKRLGGRLLLKKNLDSEQNPPAAEPNTLLGPATQHNPSTTSAATPKRSLFGPFEEDEANAPTTEERPTQQEDTDGSGSDSDLPAEPQNNERLLALVARKREERVAKEAEAAREREEREARLQKMQHVSDAGSESGSDQEIGQRLTQQARPTRKASKKAIEEMHRETQRMSRNMQLAHEARTKKKITKDSLFARFNFRTTSATPATDAQKNTENTQSTGDSAQATSGSSSAPTSDAEHAAEKETPPTSPASPAHVPSGMGEMKERVAETVMSGPVAANDVTIPMQEENEDSDGPTIEELISQPIRRIDKGKGKAMDDVPLPDIHKMDSITQGQKRASGSLRSFRVRLPEYSKTKRGDDSDSDLEIVPAQSKKLSVFDRAKPQEKQDARSYVKLRALAHLISPSRKKRNDRPSMNPVELQAMLQQRARQQAAKQREERIQELRAKGIVIQTAEERDRAQMEVEDLVENARREAEEIMRREKEASNKEKRAAGIEVSDDEEDGDWEGDSEEGDDERDGERSGSEDEEDQDDAEEEEENEQGLDEHNGEGGIIDDEAAEGDDSETDEDESPEIPQQRLSRKARQSRVISDDEDEEENKPSQGKSSPVHQKFSMPTNESGIPGLPGMKEAPMSLTQMFQGTMAGGETQIPDTSNQVDMNEIDQEQDSLAYLRQLPGTEPSELRSFMEAESQEIVKDSQGFSQPEEITLHYSQFDAIGVNDFSQGVPATQLSDIPDPTQDAGLRMNSLVQSQQGTVEDPTSTVATVILPPRDEPKRKGRLRRRGEERHVLSDVEEKNENLEQDASEQGDFEISANAFDVLRKGARKPKVTPFDKENSKAKGMIEEQAEESEDEYAGLGGASDDENASEDDEEVRKMIDEGDVQVDERELAALYADKERASDEKQVEKLFRDITTGMLRRKRGADLDLSDSDDDGEARRRRKRREFAKMRKALLADENVGKIAENPKKMAFLRAIEDRDEEEGVSFLDQTEDDFLMPPMSQSQSQSQDPSNLQQPQQYDATEAATSHTDEGSGKRKRSIDETEGNEENRPPPHLRHRSTIPSSKSKRPSTLAEIRQSLAFLTEAPNAQAAAPAPDEDEESDDNRDLGEDEVDRVEDSQASMEIISGANDAENPQTSTTSTTFRANRTNDPFASRRTTRSHAVIDRISLRRAASSNASSASATMAFHDPSASSSPSFPFRVPGLVRRATSNLSAASLSNSAAAAQNASPTGVVVATERQAGADGSDSILKRGGTKKSSINYHQNARAREREVERTRAIRKSDKKREEGRLKMASQRGSGLLGMIGGGGSFD